MISMVSVSENGGEEPLDAITTDVHVVSTPSTAIEADKTSSSLPPTTLEVVPVVVLDQNYPLEDDEESDQDDQVHATGVDSPITTRELLEFAVPTLGIWILQPVLSLIDSSVVGVSAGTTELAALGPGIAWVDSTAYLLMVIGMFTTNNIASNLNVLNEDAVIQSIAIDATLDDLEDELELNIAFAETKPVVNDEIKSIISKAMLISIYMGFILMFVQSKFALPMMKVLSGAATASIPYSVKYVQIRSLAAPFATTTIVAQAAFLACKDPVTPLKAVLVGALVNTIGDIYLVTKLGFGIAGAAWATTLSQILGTVYLIGVATTRVKEAFRKKHRQERKMKFNDYKELIVLPTIQDLKNFLKFAAPLFVVLFVKCFLWSFTTYACAFEGIESLAAHQILLNVFLYFAIFGEVVSTMSQNFLPSYVTSQDNKIDSFGKKILNKISKISVFVGVVNSLLAFALPHRFPHVFTKSVIVMENMKAMSVPICLATLPHCYLSAIEGGLIATKDLKFCFWIYNIFAAGFLGGQIACIKKDWGLKGIWWVMAAYQWIKMGIFVFRSQMKNRKLVNTISKSDGSVVTTDDKTVGGTVVVPPGVNNILLLWWKKKKVGNIAKIKALTSDYFSSNRRRGSDSTGDIRGDDSSTGIVRYNAAPQFPDS